MRPIVVQAGSLAAAGASVICTSQTPTAGNLTLNGVSIVNGVGILDNPRRILITAAANESAKTFTITGTNSAGNVISETITGPNISSAYSVLDYSTITSISISANAAGAVTVGTNGIGGSPWVRLDTWDSNFVTIQCTASGTVNYTIQGTLDDPNSPTNAVVPSAMTWVNSPDAAAVGASSTIITGYTLAPIFVRVLLNSGSGSVVATIYQTENG